MSDTLYFTDTRPTVPATSTQENIEDPSASSLKGRAIVTYGRSLIALVIARSLHERGIEVIGCDDVGMTVLSFSKHTKENFVHTSFEKDEEQAILEFEEAVRKYAPEDDRPYVLIPSFRDARLFAKYRDRFEPLIKIAAPDVDSIRAVDPKDNFARFTKEHGLAAPETQIILPENRGDSSLHALPFPRIIKPVDGVGGRGIELLKSPDDLDTYLADAPHEETLLLQEPIDGEDYCASVIADHGEMIGIVVYHNIRQFPVESGAGAIRETVDPAPFIETTRRLLQLSKWHGVCEIDYRWDGQQSSDPKLLEVNPRYWAGLFHSTASGVDFSWMAYCLAAGLPVEKVRPEDVKQGFKTRTPAAWLLSIAEDVAANDEHLKQSGRAWDYMKAHASRGHVALALKRFLDSTTHALAAPALLSKIQEEAEKHSSLPSEFTADDDPAVSLGILFALSSLIRHGELPPELKFDVKADEESPPETTHSKKTSGHRPVIGITKPDDGDWLSFHAMKFAVWLAGGKPVKITSRAPRDPHSIDGLIFGGGSDVYPGRYHGTAIKGRRYDQDRDEMEATWAKAAYDHHLPVLGICRGMQMMNVLAGGSLHQDLSSFADANYPNSFFRRIFYRKTIRISDASWLSKLSNTSTQRVNSIHTQAVRELGRGYKIAAQETNGLIQSIEHKYRDNMVGVQFHPEFLIYRPFARKIFKRLVDASRVRHAERHG